MKLLFRVLFLLTAFFVLSAGVVMAQAPTLPVLFQGAVLIDGAEAPVGTLIVAEVDGIEVATNSPEGIDAEGSYILVVPGSGSIDIGKMVVFKVDGLVAGEHEYVSSISSPVVELDLNVQTGLPGTNGTTGPGDTTPGTTKPSSADFFGLGLKTFIGIVAGGVALIILLIVMINRHRRYI